MQKKRILTWIKPTSQQLHIANYFWAIKHLLDFQAKGEYDIVAFVANMHWLTQVHDGEAMQRDIYSVVRAYLASWLDPDKVRIFKHSDIYEHAELNWVLSCITTLGYMKRMHAFKDALNKWTSDELTMGTFNYPILMAADIILYDADYVPVGRDQKQHLEFTRDIAQKFNSTFGDTFKLPEHYIPKAFATVPGIDGRKMSKSYNNYIGLFDEEKVLLKKCKSIATDSIPIQDPKDPDKCNVYNILKLFLTETEDKDLRSKYTAWWLAYSEVKMQLFDALMQFLWPIQTKAKSITDADIDKVLQDWANKARPLAQAKMSDVYKKIGFGNHI